MARRFEMTDADWERVTPLPPGKAGAPGRAAADNRRFLDAVLLDSTVVRAHPHAAGGKGGHGPKPSASAGAGSARNSTSRPTAAAGR